MNWREAKLYLVMTLLAGAGLLAGCAHGKGSATTAVAAQPDPTPEAVLRNMEDIDMALRLYVAKEGRAPESAGELGAFLERQGVGIELLPGWEIDAGIEDGVCRYTEQYTTAKGRQAGSGQFAVAGLDYKALLEANADMQQALNGPPKKVGLQGSPEWMKAMTPTESQSRGLGE